jgi:hypothetical protein
MDLQWLQHGNVLFGRPCYGPRRLLGRGTEFLPAFAGHRLGDIAD